MADRGVRGPAPAATRGRAGPMPGGMGMGRMAATRGRPYAPASFFILATMGPLTPWPASTDT